MSCRRKKWKRSTRYLGQYFIDEEEVEKLIHQMGESSDLSQKCSIRLLSYRSYKDGRTFVLLLKAF